MVRTAVLCKILRYTVVLYFFAVPSPSKYGISYYDDPKKSEFFFMCLKILVSWQNFSGNSVCTVSSGNTVCIFMVYMKGSNSWNSCNKDIIFHFQLPFTLTLRVWDIFMLEGEKILTGMSYNVIKLQRRKWLLLTPFSPVNQTRYICKQCRFRWDGL